MSWCVVVNCSSKSKKKKNKKKNEESANVTETEKKTFFSLPTDSKMRSIWLKNINRTALPSIVKVCSDHFEESCFDPSWDIQNSCSPYKNRTQRRKLLPTAIPTIFPYKDKPKERETSTRRRKIKEHEEV